MARTRSGSAKANGPGVTDGENGPGLSATAGSVIMVAQGLSANAAKQEKTSLPRGAAECRDRIVEEHHAMAGEEQVDRGQPQRGPDRIAGNEAAPLRPDLLPPGVGDRDQVGRQVEADHLCVGPGRGDRQAGRARAAAEIDHPAHPIRRRQDPAFEMILQAGEAAVGPPPLARPGLAYPTAPVRSAHRALSSKVT